MQIDDRIYNKIMQIFLKNKLFLKIVSLKNVSNNIFDKIIYSDISYMFIYQLIYKYE